MKKILDILAATSMFSGLPEEDLRALRQIAVDKFYDRDRTIFLEGEPADGFYVVADGRVKIYKLSAEGKEHILHIYDEGNPFGEVPVFSGKRFPANAQTLLKSHLLFFPRTAFAKLIADNPSLSMNMLAVLSMRLREFTVQIENLSLKEVPGRLADYLLVLGKEQEDETSVSLGISKGQLASLLGTIPETLSRILAKMSKEGLIQVDGKTIRFLDRRGLEDLAVHGKLGI
jgi:CRP-like cAMP-binding protein